jgi:short subunit dehydrogenase-like uncharacterized protein
MWMIYGANGYTGELIARKAVKDGHRPYLAGRDLAKIRPLAEALNLPWRVFDLASPESVQAALEDMSLVIHCAGPFSATSAPMVEACLATSTHYIDITGEIAVFEAIQALDSKAKKAGCLLVPGCGFDVVPTDCLAATLAQALPDATHLELAFCGAGGTSPGTLKTMIEMLGDGGRVRADGEIIKVPAGYRQKMIPFSKGEQWCMTIPWGDVSTAYYSTAIPNIEVYTAVPRRTAKITRLISPLLGVMKFKPLQNLLKARVGKSVQGPSQKVRDTGATQLWGKVTNAKGESREATLDTLEGYQFTVEACTAIAYRILDGLPGAGAMTPSRLLGANFVQTIPGSVLTIKQCDA